MSPKQAEATRPGPFRFFDLPPELRNHIYTFCFLPATDDDKPCNLATVRPPALTRASAQLRAEALPLFFAANRFSVFVKSNFEQRKQARMRLPRTHRVQRESVLRQTGVLGIRAPAKAIIRAANRCVASGERVVRGGGTGVLFRDVQFKIAPAPVTAWAQNAYGEDGLAAVVVHLHVVRSRDGMKLVSRVEPGKKWPGEGRGGEFDREDVEATLAAMLQVAREIGNRDGFKGLWLNDLELIARTLTFAKNLP